MTKYTILTREFLEREYIENRKSLYTIAKEIGSSHIPVLKAMKRYGIERRTKKESNKGLHVGRKWCREDVEKRRVGLLKHYETAPAILGMLGKKHTEETKLKMSITHSGELNPMYGKKGEACVNWKGGAKNERETVEYREWRKSVWKRDNFTCTKCGKVGKNLHAHHIKHFAKFPELRYEIDNGTTLCKLCHNELHWGKPLVDNVPQPTYYDEATCW